MAVFITARANRNIADYMEELIRNIFYAEYPLLFRMGYGVFYDSAESVIYAFRAVHNANQRLLKVKVHCMELHIEGDKEEADIISVADAIGRYFYGKGFQAFITVFKVGKIYCVKIVVNASSFIDGHAFHDNNKNYLEVLQYLQMIAPFDWKIEASNSVFFQPGVSTGNYINGMFPVL